MNNLKTVFLLSLLTSLLVGVGWLIGGFGGMIIFLVIGAVINFGSFWFSDKLVLKMSGAKEVTAEEEPNLHRLVEDVVSLVGMPKPKVYMIATDTPNAFATGRGPKNAAVAVTTGIMRILDYQELKGVIAHELGHIRNRDILIQTVVATVAGAITMVAWMLQWTLIFGGGRRDNQGGNPLGIIGLLATIILAPIAATIIRLAISRSREYEADATGRAHDPRPGIAGERSPKAASRACRCARWPRTRPGRRPWPTSTSSTRSRVKARPACSAPTRRLRSGCAVCGRWPVWPNNRNT